MTLSLTVQNPTAEDADIASEAKTTSVELPPEIFDVQLNVALIHQVVVAQLAAARQGSASTKTRGEVRGGGKKPYRQKGTGRARQGSTRAPQFAGGGVVHGPKPRSYEQRTPKKMKAAALRGALSDRARNDRVFVVSALVAGDAPSTSSAARTLARISAARHVLVVAERSDELAWKSLRNLSTVHLLEPGQLNTYDVLISDDVVFTEAALAAFLAGPAKGRAGEAARSRVETPAVAAVEVADDEVADDEVADDEAAEKLAKKAAASDAPKPKAGDAPYGKGSHVALEDGSQPDGFPIKGNADSMLYHVPDSAFYERTVAEVWFATAAAAEKAGFALPPSQRDKETGTDAGTEGGED
ncbi:MAG: 50S ribosomal protein L4 [Jatrophihabitantaceae bacterium]